MSKCTDILHSVLQLELSRNKCRDKRIDVWPRAVDTTVFHPAFRSQAMRERMSGGNADATILVYVGRLGAGMLAGPTDASHAYQLLILHHKEALQAVV